MKIKTRSSKLARLKNTIYGIFLGTLLVLAGIIALSQFREDGPVTFLSVQSGSMEPAISTGSMIVTKPSSIYSVGSVVTYKEASRNVLVTHRIIDIRSDEAGLFYVTQGDANDAPDRQQVRPGDITGRVIATVPLVGYVVQYARTEVGFALVVLIPTAVIVFHELMIIKSELWKLITNAANDTEKHSLHILEK